MLFTYVVYAGGINLLGYSMYKDVQKIKAFN